MIAVEVVTAETGIPLCARNQLAVRDVERIAPELEVLVAGGAGGGGHGDTFAGVLAMAGRAGLRAELGARLRESRLEEAMHGMGILLARMTIDELRVGDAPMAGCHIGVELADPAFDLCLSLRA